MSVSVWLGMAEGFDWRRTGLFTAVGAVTMAALLACLALARRGQARARADLDRDRFNPYEATVYRTPDGATVSGCRRQPPSRGHRCIGGVEQIRRYRGSFETRRVLDRAGGGIAGADRGRGASLRACGHPQAVAGRAVNLAVKKEPTAGSNDTAVREDRTPARPKPGTGGGGTPSPPSIFYKLLTYMDKKKSSDFDCTNSCYSLQATVGDCEGMFRIFGVTIRRYTR